MDTHASARWWQVVAILVARLIFGGFFAMAAIFKFADIGATAGYIASVGFPFPLLLAWLAAFFELALALCLLTGAYFTEASVLAAAYVLFLAFAFHGLHAGKATGPSSDFSFFTSHSSPACCSRRCTGRGRRWRFDAACYGRRKRLRSRGKMWSE